MVCSFLHLFYAPLLLQLVVQLLEQLVEAVEVILFFVDLKSIFKYGSFLYKD